ncbi:hypothetical protein Desdi_2926 [Desulfitobacterium dichloroeliminans LMG P-21439]|uniref:Uncharacterized protein n=1 Tax=Desulfitobacterium dichloroeliminans (strain LMG P-21439 / DCA1) TaxID=871963 RepID=L0FAT2_DESDL|nr:hypothetical protein [Desulfitobacterium dichloroeliminans]AGA70337.1 hypothetical protein Desdi_2926 [Desulfitobacterium dichloroeliminans LMG P-21439]
MSRTEILSQERNRIIMQLSQGVKESKAKLLTSLMDIDAEMEELEESEKALQKIN